MSGETDSRLVIRAYDRTDRDAVVALAPRLLIGVAEWRDPEAVRAVVTDWLASACDDEERAPDNGNAEAGDLIVAELDGRPVGLVHVGRFPHFSGDVDGYVGELVVAKPFARRGIGRALLRAAEERLRGKGFTRIGLHTGMANRTARDFYAAAGFGEEDVYLSKPL